MLFLFFISASKIVFIFQIFPSFSDVYEEIDKIGGRKISVKSLNASINCGKIKGKRLIEKLMKCAKMVEECAGTAHIVNSRIPNILIDLFTGDNLSISIVNDL